MKRSTWLTGLSLLFLSLGCNQSNLNDQAAKKNSEFLANRKDAIEERLKLFVELGGQKPAIPEGGDVLRDVSPDFIEVTEKGRNPDCNAAVLVDAELADLAFQLKNRTTNRPPVAPPKEERSWMDNHRLGVAGKAPRVPVRLLQGPGSDLSTYVSCLFEGRVTTDPDKVVRQVDDLQKVRYLLIAHRTAATSPRTLGEDKGRPGRVSVLDGSLGANVYLFDLQEKRCLGGFKVLATNSPTVEVTRRANNGSDLELDTLEALAEDLASNFTREFWTEVKAHIPAARVPEADNK